MLSAVHEQKAYVPGAWKTGAFGILEPDPARSELVPPEEIDLVLCPCAGFDGDGNRVGMGAGYYDRYLPRCSNAAIYAVAFEAQRLEQRTQLDLENGYLTISTEKALENKEEKKGRVIRQERYSGTMSRSFYVGEHVTEEDIKAKYENGVLSLSFPKKEAPKVPEKKTILIEG